MRKLLLTLCFGLLLCAPTTSLSADCGLCGDINGDGSVDIGDVTAYIIWLQPPFPFPDCPADGDVNCDNSRSGKDLDILIDYLFENGPAPCDTDEWPACL